MRLTGKRGILQRSRLLRGRKARQRRRALRDGTKLLIGAGGLLLFIVGVKRNHRLDEVGAEPANAGVPPAGDRDSCGSA